jgi:hypothetical protein
MAFKIFVQEKKLFTAGQMNGENFHAGNGEKRYFSSM